jgi:hypothetical protein
MKAEIRYINYKIYDNDGFTIHFKISKKGITACNKIMKNEYPHEFRFVKSDPELIGKFGKALTMAHKLSKEIN